MAKVFIGMSVYNGEGFLKPAIQSLLNQSFTDFTLFISDDASTDNSSTTCLEYASKDPRVMYYRQEKNIGMFPNFKFLIDKADGDYFMWASQDDIWEKDFIKVCVENIENKKVDATITQISEIDSGGRSVREQPDLLRLSGNPGLKQVLKYVLQPEILGKGNFMYSLFKTNVIKKVWDIYPQRMEWGSDYHFSLALVSHFKVYVDNRILFKKRHGGFSSTELGKEVDRIIIKDPKNHMFPFGRFKQYFKNQMQAVRGTPYASIVALVLLIRLPRALFIHLKERNYKKFFRLNT